MANLSQSEAAHLLRRTGFGAKPRDLAKFTGLSRAQAADKLLGYRVTKFKPRGRDIDAVRDRWIKYMVLTNAPLQEKLVLFWHDHFATSNDKVQDEDAMALQNQTLRLHAKGNFKDFVKAINKDAAMMQFLDTVRNRDQQPNENYARELQELFTLGVYDFNGNANYAQEDIVQIARAFTGWTYDGNYVPFMRNGSHDFMAEWPARGPKVIYTTVGGFGSSGRDFTVPNGEGEPEIDAVIDIIFDHTDTDGKNTVARYITRKLISYFAHPDPSVSFIDDVIASSQFAANGSPNQWSIAALLKEIFVHDDFYLSAQPPGAGTTKSFKWPIDYVVATMRLCKMRFRGSDQLIARSGFSYVPVRNRLATMGQTLLEPPSVFGWDWEEQWASSQTMLERFRFARDVTMCRDGHVTSFRPEKLMDLTVTDPAVIVDTVTGLLGVTDQLTGSERQALIHYIDPSASNNVDLLDFDVRNTKLHGLFALVMQSPAYQMH
jgi:uncharacterized protein (DUF1800 family)